MSGTAASGMDREAPGVTEKVENTCSTGHHTAHKGAVVPLHSHKCGRMVQKG